MTQSINDRLTKGRINAGHLSIHIQRVGKRRFSVLRSLDRDDPGPFVIDLHPVRSHDGLLPALVNIKLTSIIHFDVRLKQALIIGENKMCKRGFREHDRIDLPVLKINGPSGLDNRLEISIRSVGSFAVVILHHERLDLAPERFVIVETSFFKLPPRQIEDECRETFFEKNGATVAENPFHELPVPEILNASIRPFQDSVYKLPFRIEREILEDLVRFNRAPARRLE